MATGNPVLDAIQMLGGDIGDYLSQQKNFQSPIPQANILTTSLPSGVASPISQPQIVPHPQGTNPIQQAVTNIQNAYQQSLPSQTYYFNKNPIQKAISNLDVVPPKAQAASSIDGYVMSTPDQYIPLIKDSANTHGVPTSILSGALANESMRWNPDVISGKINSPAGAQGIAQFMPDTAKGIGIDPLNPKQAIDGMGKLLASYYKRFGNRWDLALAAYNAGPGNVEKYKGIPPFAETQNYVKNIMKDASSKFFRSTGN